MTKAAKVDVAIMKVQVDEYQDEISVNNRVLDYERFVYYLLNKPKGVISAKNLSNRIFFLILLMSDKNS